MHNHLKAEIKKRMARAEQKIEAITKEHQKMKADGSMLTEHAGWDKGYWEGRLSAFDAILEELE